MTVRDRQQPELEAPGAADAEWIVQADRLAPLVDGLEYFRGARSSFIQAREQILIVGWELHSEIDLLRGDEAERALQEEEYPVRFADLLLELVERRQALHIYLLIWEGASFFKVERQYLPRMKRPWATHPRITLVWDRDTPRLAAQHQKIVVVDDRVAYAGGMDLTKSRWDDHAHEPRDERRRGPGWLGGLGSPYHDVMLAVDGEAARVLGAWCRERWRRATGSLLPAPGGGETDGTDPWPEGVEPLLCREPVAVALTQPDWAGRPEKRQVESSYVAQIREARRLIFIETQYLTSRAVARALGERLREPDGPEVIIILPYGCEGPIQAMALDPTRDELLDELRARDDHERLGVYWPTLKGGSEEDVFEHSVYIHAKTMVIDDRLLRIGSANLNNRSMGLDTELDLFVQVRDGEGEKSIAAYRQRLLAHLLHVTPQDVAGAEQACESVRAAIEALRGGQRTLHPFQHRAQRFARVVSIDPELADPNRPLEDIDADLVLRALRADRGFVERLRRGVHVVLEAVRRFAGLLALVAIAVVLAVVWTYTPLSDQVDRESIARVLDGVRSSSAGVLGITAGFILLATVGAPVTVLIGAIGSMFDIWWAVPICLAGVLASALAGFGIGRVVPFELGKLPSGGRLEGLGTRLGRRGVLTITIVRNLPIAPFAVINVACGMTSIAWWEYLLGTILGMLPGIVLIGLFGNELGALLAEPTAGGLLKLLGVAALIIVAAIGADAALRRWGPGPDVDRSARE